MKNRILLLLAIALICTTNVNATCQAVSASLLATGQTDWGDMSTQDDGSGVWTYNPSYGAYAKKQGGHTGYLFTPSFDFTDAETVTVSFQHTHRYASNPSGEYTMYVTSNFQGSFEASSWVELIIDPYASNYDWNFVSVSIDVPVVFTGSNTVFAFKYKVESSATNSPTWEIKDLNIQATCKGGTTDIETLPVEQCAQKTIENGKLYITLPDGSKYNVVGIRVR